MRVRHSLPTHNRRTFLAATTAGLGTLASVASEPARAPGDALRPSGAPSPYEKPQRDLHESMTPGNGWNYTPLQDLYDIITPSSLHFERHHAGVPRIDPDAHELLLHGAVARPLAFTMSDLRNTWVKWLHRLHVSDRPAMHREEAAYYTDLMPGGKARIFTFVMEAKSVITRPAGEQRLNARGVHEITGLAWSGRGRISRVEVSTDGGRTWQDAELQQPVLSKALTRFRLPWRWDGQDAVLQSRCTDETGYVQPPRDEIVAVRGVRGTDHYNGIKSWQVQADGRVISV